MRKIPRVFVASKRHGDFESVSPAIDHAFVAS